MQKFDAKLYGVLDSQSFKKIFPEEYFDKFASHLKVLEFQKQLFASPPQPGKLKFATRSKGSSAQKPKFIKPRTMLTKFAKIPDTIENDRHQIVRFRQINKMIAENMQNPEKQVKIHKENHPNEIKKISTRQDINTKIIDEMMIESTRQINKSIQQKLQALKKKSVFCKFTQRDPQLEGKKSIKMKLQWPTMKRYNSQKKMNSISNNFESTFSKKLLENSLQQKTIELQLQNQKENNFQLKLPIDAINQRLQTRSRSNSMRGANNMNSTNRVKSTKKLLNKMDDDEQSPVRVDLVNETRKLIQKKHLLKSFLYTQDIINQPYKQTIAHIIGNQLISQR